MFETHEAHFQVAATLKRESFAGECARLSLTVADVGSRPTVVVVVVVYRGKGHYVDGNACTCHQKVA